MNILIVGSGGREHALAWKAAQSPRVDRLFIAPGNAGTRAVGENIPIRVDDTDGLVRFARERQIDLALIGPEGPLASGLSDNLLGVGVRVFGPSRAAARIEASKAFAKAFMARHRIPTAQAVSFTLHSKALTHLRAVDYPIVLKASGLAAGKGVILPESEKEAEEALARIMLNREFGAAGDEVLIEERLQGEEVSLLAFTDGITVKPLPPARDHKRLIDRDRGPNTGGMGAYAPAPQCPPALVDELCKTVLQRAVDGLRAEGIPFCGVLYAGLMLTPAGVRVLEFNCRFGDPETQPLMLLLDSDLVEIADACAAGHLADIDIHWKSGAAACVVMAAAGYPDKPCTGDPIRGLEESATDAVVFHAATQSKDGAVVTSGGRVLGISAYGESLDMAINSAYAAVNRIEFQGMQFRHDIGRYSSYASSGVSIDSGNRAVELMRDAVKSTYDKNVVAGIGAFGGMYDAGPLKAMHSPVLVASTDGVGTKVKLAAQARRYRAIGCDLVNHCINDILVQGARPLFFLDYYASSRLEPEHIAEIVSGMAEACRTSGCVLLGGETAEMPGVYAPGEFDVAGTIVGTVERGSVLPRPDLCAGDVLIGLASSGAHTNGYSLIRKVFEGVPLNTVYPELQIPLGDALLAPHRSYLDILRPVLDAPTSPVKALAHVTGGGVFENLPRVLPEALQARVRQDSFPVTPLFRLIQQRGNISTTEMYRVFNMGIGMIAVVAADQVERMQSLVPEQTFVIGQLEPGPKRVVLE